MKTVCMFVFMVLIPLSDSSFNLAAGRTTYQSSNFGSFTADKAVDGFINRFGYNQDVGCSCCSHTAAGQTTALWQVDLGTINTIKDVKIYYRRSFTTRFAGFHVYVSNTTRVRSTLCFKDEGPNLPSATQTISCPYNTRYVIIYNERLNGVNYPSTYSPTAFLELCEVEVDGCPIGRYGTNCFNICSNGCTSNICDPNNGHCSCRDDFEGETCDACRIGRYGVNCNEICSVGCADGVCERNGTCTMGCQNGFTGQKCDVCSNGLYGNYCNMSCSVGCIGDVCLRSDGNCSNGCRTGFVAMTCDECQSGLFGYNCTSQCSDGCSGGTCQKESGICVHNCTERYAGLLCHQCIDGKYGDKCDVDCPENCLDNRCIQKNGTCLLGCIDNWNGPRCDSCINGKYGINCEMNCSVNCIDVECNHTSGECLNGCSPGWDGMTCNVSFASRRTSPSGSQGSVIGGVVVGILVVIAGVILFILFMRRRNLRSKSDSNRNIIDSVPDITATSPPSNDGSVPDVNDKQLNGKVTTNNTTVRYNRSDIYENTTELYYNVNEPGIPVKELSEYISLRTKSEFEEEYNKLPDGSRFPHEHSAKQENKAKNRFQKAYCYDHSRIILDSFSEEPDSDYINANYIDGVEDRQFYIATQGPRFNTVVDFWRMVWQVKSSTVVMLTGLVENGKVKCEQYWPDLGKELKASHLIVTTEAVLGYGSYSLRKIRIENRGEDQSRLIFQYHFTSWPDHGTPDPMELILFHSRIKRNKKAVGPKIVHCSAGIGRTGTFIALDALSEYGKRTGRIDIFDFVKTMRKDRMNMVQTLEQYIFLHDVLAGAFGFKDTSITKEQIINMFSDQTSVDTNCDAVYTNSKPTSRIEEEFELLQAQKHVYSKIDYKTALTDQNQDRNKENCPLAIDKYRPYVMSRLPKGSNYINAVFLSSYNNRKGYIVSHLPLPNTVIDLWSVIVDQGSKKIVLLDLDDQEDVKKTTWLPTNDSSMTVGPFTVRKEANEEEFTNGTKREVFDVTEEEKPMNTVIQVYSFSSKDKEVPWSKQDILELVEAVDNSVYATDSGPIIVICPDGAKACGMFCAIRDLVTCLKLDEEVDVYQTVRGMQLRRPECISTLEQYRYCYEVLNYYLTSENVYANN